MTTSDDHRDPGILEDAGVDDDALTADERDPEASPEDVQEQVTLADPAEAAQPSVALPADANEWDAVEQARVVELDEDYR